MATSPVRTSRVKDACGSKSEQTPLISSLNTDIKTNDKVSAEGYPMIDVEELEERKRRSRRLRQERLKQNMIFKTGAFLLMIGVAFICKWLQNFVKTWKQSGR